MTMTDVLTPPVQSPMTGASEERLLADVAADCRTYHALGLLADHGAQLTSKWEALVKEQPGRFIRPDGSLDAQRLQRFRRHGIFLADWPGYAPTRWNLRNWTGGRRGIRRLLLDCYRVLEQRGYLDLLHQHPTPTTGAPHVFTHRGARYTYRWFKHIYYSGLLKRHLGAQLSSGPFTAMDIGGGFGLYATRLRQMYAGAHTVLVDFPEQMLLARYFLGKTFPGARCAGITELQEVATVSRDWLASYDFVLMPCTYYPRLAAGSIDLVSNFASLGEMTREWFNFYVQGTPFTTAKWFFTANRMESASTWNTDLAILDYPIWDPAKRLHFDWCPAFSHYYERRWLVMTERVPFSPYFEYLGRLA